MIKRVRQAIPKDTVVVPKLDEEDHERIKEEVKSHAQELENKPKRQCIICHKVATHCVKGSPHDAYCKACGKEQFKYLNYLERLS